MENHQSKIMLFESKTIERYPYSIKEGEHSDSKEVITKIINEALGSQGIKYKYARARLYGYTSGPPAMFYYTIEYWD
jgi:hypothetical protein